MYYYAHVSTFEQCAVFGSMLFIGNERLSRIKQRYCLVSVLSTVDTIACCLRQYALPVCFYGSVLFKRHACLLSSLSYSTLLNIWCVLQRYLSARMYILITTWYYMPGKQYAGQLRIVFPILSYWSWLSPGDLLTIHCVTALSTFRNWELRRAGPTNTNRGHKVPSPEDQRH